MASPTDWQKLKADIMAALDVRAEYEALGVTFKPNSEANANGWIPCHAVGRDDRNPSAAVNVKTGVYKDQGGQGDSLGLYEFMVRAGKAKDWRDAQAQLAKKTGLAKRLPKKDQARPQDKIEEVTWNPLAVRGLVGRFPGVKTESLTLAGAKLCKYPAGSAAPQYVVALGAYGPAMLDEPPRGFVLQSASGIDLEIYQGEGKAPDRRKRTNIGPSGMVGRHALKVIQEKHDRPEEIEIVWKVEGISDLLALQSAIPPELRDTHLVLTNAAGANETSLPAEVSSVVFLNQRLVILHDCDEPGQNGAKVWMGAAAKYCRSAVNLVLPFDITPDHGKDLRDWLNAGGTYQQLLAMAEEAEKVRREQLDIAAAEANRQAGAASSATTNGQASSQNGHTPPHPPATNGDETLTGHQAILKRMGAIVLGHVSGGSRIFAFAEKTGKTFEIGDIGRYKIEHLLFDLGEHVEALINTSPEPDPTKITFNQAKKAFAVEGGKRILSDSGYLGAGVWEVNGRLMLVNSGSAAIWNCKFSETRIPSCEGKLLDFGCPEPWFDFRELSEMLKASESREWCDAALNEAIELFSRWDNWRHEDNPQLIAALICCTWLQTIWAWRPQVAVAGPTASGKSMFLETTLKHIFGPMAMFCAKATAAGIRQQVKNTAKIILIDEFEHDKNRQETLELFRTSSRGAEIIRGTSDQKGTKFGLRHIPWVGAIETGMRKAADRNRYVMLELEKVKPGRGVKLRLPAPSVLRLLGQKLLVLGMRHWKVAIRFAEELQTYPVEGVDHRAIETYAVPAAMLGAIMGLDEKGAAGLMVGMLTKRDFSQQQESDEEQLLKAIFESIVFLKGGERASVSELLKGTVSEHNESPSKVLQRVGVRKVSKEDGKDAGEYLFFAPQTICRELLKGTEFATQNIEEILGRIPGAKRDKQRMGGHSPRGILIPDQSVYGIVDPGELVATDGERGGLADTTIDYQDF